MKSKKVKDAEQRWLNNETPWWPDTIELANPAKYRTMPVKALRIFRKRLAKGLPSADRLDYGVHAYCIGFRNQYKLAEGGI